MLQLTTVQIKHGIIGCSVSNMARGMLSACIGMDLMCLLYHVSSRIFALQLMMRVRTCQFLSSCKFCRAISYLEDNDKKNALGWLMPRFALLKRIEIKKTAIFVCRIKQLMSLPTSDNRIILQAGWSQSQARNYLPLLRVPKQESYHAVTLRLCSSRMGLSQA